MDKKVEDKIEDIKEKANDFKDNYLKQLSNIFKNGGKHMGIVVYVLATLFITNIVFAFAELSFMTGLFATFFHGLVFWFTTMRISEIITPDEAESSEGK